MEKVKTTNFYIPNKSKPSQLCNIEDLSLSDIPITADQISESEDEIVKIGLFDGNKRNLLYTKLIVATGINYLDNIQIYSKYWQALATIECNTTTNDNKNNLGEFIIGRNEWRLQEINPSKTPRQLEYKKMIKIFWNLWSCNTRSCKWR